jgi:hypothetical protein
MRFRVKPGMTREGVLTTALRLCIFDSEQMCRFFVRDGNSVLAVEDRLALLFGLMYISLEGKIWQHRA